MEDIVWNDGALSSLVLPKDYRKLIVALVESQFKHDGEFDDVITGKGTSYLYRLRLNPD